MAVRIVDPAEILRETTQERDKFDPIAYSNMSIPSFVHGYSLAVEYAKNWFLDKFPKGLFKKESVQISNRYVVDDYRRLTKSEILSREKPLVIITPQLTYDYDLETVNMYNYGPDLIARAGWRSDPFFRDSERHIKMIMNMQLMEVRFNYRVVLYTMAQQMDMYKRMEILFRIGSNQGEDLDLDFHIPTDIIINIASDAGFEVDADKQMVKDVIGFTKYLNMKSAFPIMYKMRNITGNHEYFMRVPSLYVWTSCLDKLTADDGEMVGQIKKDYSIEMQTIVRIPVPQFYVYYTQKPIKYSFVKDELSPKDVLYDINTFRIMDIPDVNEKHWEKNIWSQYIPDEKDEGKIDLNELFDKSEFKAVLDYTKDQYISPSSYLDIRVYRNAQDWNPGLNPVIATHMDWENNTIVFDEIVPRDAIYIAIYMDNSYYNDTIIKINEADKNRMSKTHEEANRQRYEDK